MRSSHVSSRAACLLALTMAIVGGVETAAHRRDEYLQAARIAIDPGGVHIELDLTPGIEMADAILADIDRNRDGALSAEEQRAYGSLVLNALELEIDGARMPAQLGESSFPEPDAVRGGEGMIRLQLAVMLPRQATGVHQLLFRNRHHPDGSVYLANALVPESADVAVTAQHRDGDQRELTIDYIMRGAPATDRSEKSWGWSTKMSHMQQLGAFTVSFLVVSALMIFGSVTKSRRTQTLMFWLVFGLVLGGSLIYRATFR